MNDPITFDRDGVWITATYAFSDGTKITGVNGAGDQAALRGLIYNMANRIQRLKADNLASSLAAHNYATQVRILNNQLALARTLADGYAEELGAGDQRDEELATISAKDRALQAALAADQAAEEAAWKESHRYVRLANMWTALAAVSLEDD